jgi:hypothetical protein
MALIIIGFILSGVLCFAPFFILAYTKAKPIPTFFFCLLSAFLLAATSVSTLNKVDNFGDIFGFYSTDVALLFLMNFIVMVSIGIMFCVALAILLLLLALVWQ